MAFILNRDSHDIQPDRADETLLFLLREPFGLTGAQFGCGPGICGTCTVMVDGVPIHELREPPYTKRHTCRRRTGGAYAFVMRTSRSVTIKPDRSGAEAAAYHAPVASTASPASTGPKSCPIPDA